MSRYIVFVCVLLTLSSCVSLKQTTDKLQLANQTFAQLPGWQADQHEKALAAFLRSCTRWDKQPAGRSLGANGIAGTVGDWQQVCAKARRLPAPVTSQVARHFFESNFQPYLACNKNFTCSGLFTGYYEIALRGSRKRKPPYIYPIYRKPPSQAVKKQHNFFSFLAGNKPNQLPSRERIERGYYKGKKLELVWVDDPIQLFFLHIQGSGRVKLTDGTVMRVGYDGSNGHGYKSIGAVLIDQGTLTREEVTAPKLKEWLYANPQERDNILNQNPSYVFFRELKGKEGPIGGQGVPVTAQRTMAVDWRYVPYGVPLWLDTTLPTTEAGPARLYRRLFIAQDTGGAIRGPIRGDVFFGYGKKPEILAGGMKQQGIYYLLLPKMRKAQEEVVSTNTSTTKRFQ